MKVYAIYDKENKFIVCFPDRVSAENYGVQTYGRESGWEYDIIEKWLYYSAFMPIYTPSTAPTPMTPYTPPIWNHSIRANLE